MTGDPSDPGDPGDPGNPGEQNIKAATVMIAALFIAYPDIL